MNSRSDFGRIFWPDPRDDPHAMADLKALMEKATETKPTDIDEKDKGARAPPPSRATAPPRRRDAATPRGRAASHTRASASCLGTPDDWVKRHPTMVRLTGRHPFNCEPPLPELMSHGFITPATLHYVRNHSAVPHCEWETHTLRVGGMVEKPMTFTMDQLAAMPAREIPVTLVCAGNRRKEENLVKQTIGFNWGAAGVSTSVGKG